MSIASDFQNTFLSTLSLRRATVLVWCSCGGACDFYPRSPCGERHHYGWSWYDDFTISIHALLAESDDDLQVPAGVSKISIHALLAESDLFSIAIFQHAVIFLSTLSLRRATTGVTARNPKRFYFYPRSPCGERRLRGTTATSAGTFLSTLSLRRATSQGDLFQCPGTDFYPRSPCGERRQQAIKAEQTARISIHALLAESDDRRDTMAQELAISIHALLAESDFAALSSRGSFYISIHALLAESDSFGISVMICIL